MKNISNFFAALIFAAMLIPANAAAGDNVVIVDIKKIVNESVAAKKIATKIEKKRKKFQEEVSEEEEKLHEEEQELAKQRNVLAKEVFQERAAEFKKKLVAAQRMVQSRRSQLENAYVKALEIVKDNTLEIIEEMAEDRNFNVAIPKSQLLYADKNLDISEEVLKKLNDNLPDVDVEIEEK